MKLEGVSFSYRTKTGTVPICEHLSISFEPGRIHTVIGGSGCGKTTLLYIMAGLLKPESGCVTYHEQSKEEPTGAQSDRSAIILQDFGLFPWKRVAENIGLGLKLRGESKRSITEQTRTILEELGIAHLKDSYPSKISGGERQRVAIARAVVLQPSILLMDEPFSSLDAMNREKMQELLLQTHERHSMTVLMVTHSIEEAAYVSSRIHIMKRRNQNTPASLLPIAEGLERPRGRSTPEFHRVVDTVRSLLDLAEPQGGL